MDDIALVGKPLADFDIEDDDVLEEDVTSDDEVIEELESIQHPLKTKVLATPAVRRIAMEHKLDLSEVTPTGRGGRVLKGDVLQHLKLIPEGTQIPHPTLVNRHAKEVNSEQKITTSPVTGGLVDKTEPLKGVALAMYKSMTESLVRTIYILVNLDYNNFLLFYRKSLIFHTVMK